MPSGNVQEIEALAVDACTNHWYIAVHGESPVPKAQISHQLAGTQAWRLIRSFGSRSFTQSIRERKQA
jgi:hypothetical protein